MTATADPVETTCLLPIKEIRLSGGTQMRAEISRDVIEDYAEIIDELPPVTVFDDGKQLFLADGFHRYKAHVFAGRDTIQCEVRKGTRRDAVLFAVSANSRHGLRRSRNDKRKAVMALLSDREWARWSDREISRQCAVSKTLVHVLRRQIEGPSPDPERRRLAPHGTHIVSMPAEKAPVSTSNGHPPAAPANNDSKPVRCPFCKKQFSVQSRREEQG
jgi:hypothetical protein